MSSRCHRLALALACSLALSLPAAAQTASAQHEMPTGDVWITQDAPTAPAIRPSEAASIVTGDVWLTPGQNVRAAERPTSPEATAAPVTTGSLK